MTPEQMQKLGRGDIVRHKVVDRGSFYVVMSNYGNRVTAVDTVDITNPDEWELVFKANHVRQPEEESTPEPLPLFVRVIVKHNHEYLVLLEKRGEEATWSYPGGRCEPGEDTEAAARREVEEETGLKIMTLRCVLFDEFVFSGRRWKGMFFLATRVIGSPVIREPERCAEMRFVREPQLMGLPGIARQPLQFAEVRDLASSFMPGQVAAIEQGKDS